MRGSKLMPWFLTGTKKGQQFQLRTVALARLALLCLSCSVSITTAGSGTEIRESKEKPIESTR